MSKTITKADNLFSLYDQLETKGDKTKAIIFMAQNFDIKRSNLSKNWLTCREIPDYIKESKIDTAIDYLQKQIKLNN